MNRRDNSRKPQHGWWDRRDPRQFKGRAPHFYRWQKQFPPPPSMLPPWVNRPDEPRQERPS